MSGYEEFLATRRHLKSSEGIAPRFQLPALYDFQSELLEWALGIARAAIFADCGRGKTLMQLAWAQALGVRTLILTPLCVAEQTVREGPRFGVPVTLAGDESESAERGITVTNYDRLHLFDASAYGAVILDESSILKSFDGKTRGALIRVFGDTRSVFVAQRPQRRTTSPS